jgi:serine/threonine protein kinase
MKMLNHENIIKLKEVLASETQIYLIVEMAEGGELFDRVVAEGRLQEYEAREYFKSLVDAISYIHDRGVVHRDLKPENLFLSAAGTLKLGDFGFATLIDTMTVNDKLARVGSPNYIAPELITGDVTAEDYHIELVDIYDCGCILFVMCAGGLPFTDNDPDVLMQHIVRGARKTPKFFSENLVSIVGHLMETDWRRRYSLSQIRTHQWMKERPLSPSQSPGGLSVSPDTRGPSPVPVSPPPVVAPVPGGGSGVSFKFDKPPPDRMAPSPGANRAPWLMSLSSLEHVQVVPKRVASSQTGMPFLNCFEYMAMCGCFDLTRMASNERSFKRRVYGFSSVMAPNDILKNLEDISGSCSKKLQVELLSSKFRVRVECVDFACQMQLMRVTVTLHVVYFKKLRGDGFAFLNFYNEVYGKAKSAGVVFREDKH